MLFHIINLPHLIPGLGFLLAAAGYFSPPPPLIKVVYFQVLGQPEHVLNGRTIDPKRANARSKPEGGKKIFVGGLDTELTDEEIRSYFEQFGNCLLYTSPSPRDGATSRMPSSA